MEEADGNAGGVEPDDEERLLVFEAEEGVERHHESALGLGAAADANDSFELRAQIAPDRVRVQHFCSVAGDLEPTY